MNSEAPQPLQAPRRGAGVQLVGRQPDSGFQEGQWLVEREGRFLQVSELLYRTVEHVDGRADLATIAAGVTEATEWTVTADHVRQLIQTRLVPAGLVASADDAPEPARPPRSPLAVNARRRVLGPRVLEPITGVLQVLFAPLLLLPVVASLAFAHLWLYLHHGVDRAIGEVLVQPALILPVTLVFVVTAVFHELGHASALRYGGGQARGIGVGIYLVYPVFFTDTTDAYRLGRWPRVRVDLGGFYFQLIAAVGLMGLSSATGQQWLLLPAFAINLEVLRQLLFPFVRLDGYWLFADLTGIPDLFSFALPFARSVLPRARRTGSKLPPLRRPTKAIFLGYLVTATAVLTFLLLQFVTHAPHVMATAWSSLQAQVSGLADALGNSDLPSAAAFLGQTLILALPALAPGLLAVTLSGWIVSVYRRRHATPEVSANPSLRRPQT